MSVKGLFKLHLNKDYLDMVNKLNPHDQEKIENVRGWFKDFLTALHDHITAHLEASPWLVDWGSTKVEYIFSLPTSWKDNDSLVEDFENIVEQAFEPDENRSVTIGLTEGEASAIYTAKGINHTYEVSKLAGMPARIDKLMLKCKL